MQRTANTRRLVTWAVLAVVGAGLAWLLWQWANDMSGVRREAPKIPAIIPLPPPPPPPPPEPPKEPEPPVEQKIAEPEPVPEAEEVKPAEDAPDPAQDLANPMQMDGDAQAGGDAFNVGSGKGSGMGGGGGGLGNGTYSQYLAYAFQRLLRDNPELRNLAFNLQAEIWLSAAGEITRVELLRPSGDPEVDGQVLAALRAAPALDQRPPASLTLPVKVALQGRRP
ncbi:TonB C-terminal domain-containing protein [Pantoea sp. Tr-811]|uniref:TonB C-terminal domain-containing protein n=1 Tax=Pantoea sp. Tr-811 TaxID=2608361 RepID=UPI0014210635|nr:TonB C-terminal domain-containing protein [Pantoea sp. Tr-811]